jgi:hypothetical protein
MPARALLLCVVLVIALPAAAGAATVSVEPYADPPGTDPVGSCSRDMTCPPDMVALSAAPREENVVAIAAERSVPAVDGTAGRHRFIVTDRIAPLQAGPGCEQIDSQTVACTAATVGPVRLRDGNDWFASSVGAAYVHGSNGEDVLHDIAGRMFGGTGDDVIVGNVGVGGGDDDLVIVRRGMGGSGDDVLRCVTQEAPCRLDGGPGNDRLTGGIRFDRLFGRRGNDILVSHEARLSVPEVQADRVDCGRGRRDRAIADELDDPTGCEHVARPEFVDPDRPA